MGLNAPCLILKIRRRNEAVAEKSAAEIKARYAKAMSAKEVKAKRATYDGKKKEARKLARKREQRIKVRFRIRAGQ